MTESKFGANPSVSLVVLTMGDRPRQLADALNSSLRQRGVEWAEVVVAFNGVDTGPVPDGVTAISTDTNEGIPGGRNVGLRCTTGEVVVFLDDDARFEGDDALAGAIRLFGAQPTLGAVGFRLVDESGETARRHVPRLGGRRADLGGDVASFLGGAVAVRRDAFEAAGGYPAEFFYSLEETDLSLGIVDAGFTISYAPDVRVFHPRTQPSRHSRQVQTTARNRVLMARRRLPWMLGILYVIDWTVLTAIRARLRPDALGAHWRGTVEGLHASGVDRRPIRWSTAWRLVRMGRPPII